jgi:hypothetical protein
MGLSFHDDTSLVEAVGSLHFAVDKPNAVTGTGMRSISQDGSWDIEPDNLDAIPGLPVVNMSQKRRDDDIDEIPKVDR